MVWVGAERPRCHGLGGCREAALPAMVWVGTARPYCHGLDGLTTRASPLLSLECELSSFREQKIIAKKQKKKRLSLRALLRLSL